MPRVDFYILPDNDSREKFACLMANKAWQQGNTVYVHTDSEHTAGTLDDLLWIFKDISFVPHTLANDDIDHDAPIIIGCNTDTPEFSEVMINLCHDIPEWADGFDRIIEIVVGRETEKHQARIRYRDYRERGYDLHNHNLTENNDHT